VINARKNGKNWWYVFMDARNNEGKENIKKKCENY